MRAVDVQPEDGAVAIAAAMICRAEQNVAGDNQTRVRVEAIAVCERTRSGRQRETMQRFERLRRRWLIASAEAEAGEQEQNRQSISGPGTFFPGFL